jgi:hypothetical protein
MPTVLNVAHMKSVNCVTEIPLSPSAYLLGGCVALTSYEGKKEIKCKPRLKAAPSAAACRSAAEMIMRQIGLALVAAGALLAAAISGTPPAAAMTAGAAPAGLRPAIAGIETVARVSCFRYGWRGWGNYPSCEKHVRKKRYKGMHRKNSTGPKGN